MSNMEGQICLNHANISTGGNKSVNLLDAREVEFENNIWITDPSYADAVHYEELSEFFLAWYKPHLQACFPDHYPGTQLRLKYIPLRSSTFLPDQDV